MTLTVLTAQGETPIGHNQPPDKFTLYEEHIAELLEQAEQFLDGEGVQTQKQADDVSALLNMLRRATKDADEARAEEKRPHDEAAKLVQTKWKPILDRAKLAADTAKNALAPFLRKQEEEQRRAAEAKRLEAEEKAEAARKAAEQASPGNLYDQTTVKVLRENAAAAQRAADKLDKQKINAKGGERAVGLRKSYRHEITDETAFARWVWANRKEEMTAFLQEVAAKEARQGPRPIPGLNIEIERTL